jgi:outer membrane protein assembly factor BamD
MRLILLKSLFIGWLAFSLSGCESLKNFSFSKDAETEDEYKDWNVEKFRKEAQTAVDAGNYEKAVKIYEALEARYPFGETSAQTQLDVAYAYYKSGDSDAALAAADRFIKINPRNPSVDYAYYLKGLVNYNRGFGFVDRFLPTDTSQRDISSAKEAYENFSELVKRFPNSKYVPDAKQRMTALKNNMAMHEVHIARFYIKRKAYVAAVNRVSGVIENYQRTPAVPYALEVLKEAYTQLEMPDQAANIERIYQMNYPSGPPVPEHSEATFSHKVWDFIGLEK